MAPPDLPLLAARTYLLAGRVARALYDSLAAALDELGTRLRYEERGGPMTEYAVLLTIAAIAIGLIAAVIAFIRGKFAAFGGGG